MRHLPTQIDRRWQLLAVLLALCVVGGLAVGAGGAIAQDDPPPVPAAYYGEITIDGEPAPEGVEVTAEIDGEERGSLVTEQVGGFGGPGAGDRKLVVEGADDDDGATVEFFVDGESADTDTDVEWESGVNQEVNLVVDTDDDETGDDDADDADDDASAGGGAGAGTGADDGDADTDTDDADADDADADIDADDDAADTDADDGDADTDTDDADSDGPTEDADTDDDAPGFTGTLTVIALALLFGSGLLTRRQE